MLSILAAIVVLGLLIFVHELGHFLAAKRLGVGVIRFSLGFGPLVFSRRIGETEYCISAVPLGGYVKMVGEDGEEGEARSAAPASSNSFASKPGWARAMIVLAGPVGNLVFAWFLYSILFATGIPVLTSAVGKVSEDMPAAAAGIAEGDVIAAVNGTPIDRWDALSEEIKASGGRPVTLVVRRGDAERTLTIEPKEIEGKSIFGEPIPTWAIGVGPAGAVFTERSDPIVAIGQGFMKTVDLCRLTLVSIVKLFQRVVPASSLGGPIRIMQLAGEQAEEGIQALMFFMAILSINLGVLNLLPIPILDGGHLAFMAVEGIMRRPLKIRHREIAQQVGMVLLICLMVFALYNDLHQVFLG